MGDKALSMSLDDYIKNQKKGGNKRGGKPGKGTPNINSRGKTTAKQGGRYFSRGGGGAQRGGGGAQRGGGGAQRGAGGSPRGSRRGGNVRPVRGGGRPRDTFDARPNRNSRGGARTRGGGRPKFNRPERPSTSSTRSNNVRGGQKANVGKLTLNTRAQRFGPSQLSPRIGRNRALSAQPARVKRRNPPPIRSRPYVHAAAPIVRIPRNPRIANRQVQQLIQKRIQRARITLTKKPVVRPARGVAVKPRGLVQRGASTSRPRMTKLQLALAQQKLNRARRVRNLTRRGVPRRVEESRGLVLDRSNVRVRVRNEATSSYSHFGQDPHSLVYGYPLMGHGHGAQMGMRADEFPPIVLNNPRGSELFQQVLDPDIQRKIAMIQNRAKSSRAHAESDILPDFRGPVNVCKVNPGDRFRMMMN